MARLFNSLRAGAEPYSVYQQPAETADEQVCRVAESLLSDAGIDFTTRNAYMWYVRELAKLLRTRHGWDLAFHLEMVMRKWQTYGLASNVMQVITCEVHNALKPAEIIRQGFTSPSSSASPKPEGRGAEGKTAKHAKSAKRKGTGSSEPDTRPQTPDPTSDIDDTAGGLL